MQEIAEPAEETKLEESEVSQEINMIQHEQRQSCTQLEEHTGAETAGGGNVYVDNVVVRSMEKTLFGKDVFTPKAARV